MTDQSQSSGPYAHYFKKLSEGEFVIQKCDRCAGHTFYPRTHCTHCGSQNLTWVEASGKGTVYSTTTVRQRPEQGGDYNVCLVDLDEGVRLMSSVVGVAPDSVAIGMAVTSKIVNEEDESVLYFEPAEEMNQ